VKVCDAEELLNKSTLEAESPPPDGVIVMAPVNWEFGVTLNALEGEFSEPPRGPEKVKLVAGAPGVTTADPLEDVLVPAALVAVNAHA